MRVFHELHDGGFYFSFPRNELTACDDGCAIYFLSIELVGLAMALVQLFLLEIFQHQILCLFHTVDGQQLPRGRT